MKSERILFVHLLRSIAPLLVIWAHLGGWWLVEAKESWEPYRLYFEHVVKTLNLFQEGGHLGVVLFFLISGYIITHVSRTETFRGFAIRRLFRLGPLLLIALLLTALVDDILLQWIGRNSLGSQSSAPVDILLNASFLSWLLGTPYILSVTWTLLVEIVFYGLTGALISWTKAQPFAASAVQLGLAAMLVGPFLLGVPIGEIYPDAMIYLPLLILGRIFYQLEARQITLRQGLTLSTFAGGLFIAFHIGRHGSQLWAFAQPPLYTYFYALIIFFAARAFTSAIPSILDRIATISYSIYLLHLPVGSLVLFGGQALGLSLWLSYPACFVAVFAVAELSYRWIEAPAQRLGRDFALRTA